MLWVAIIIVVVIILLWSLNGKGEHSHIRNDLFSMVVDMYSRWIGNFIMKPLIFCVVIWFQVEFKK